MAFTVPSTVPQNVYLDVLKCAFLQARRKKKKAWKPNKYRYFGAFPFGADSQIRTGDLILTKGLESKQTRGESLLTVLFNVLLKLMGSAFFSLILDVSVPFACQLLAAVAHEIGGVLRIQTGVKAESGKLMTQLIGNNGILPDGLPVGPIILAGAPVLLHFGYGKTDVPAVSVPSSALVRGVFPPSAEKR